MLLVEFMQALHTLFAETIWLFISIKNLYNHKKTKIEYPKQTFNLIKRLHSLNSYQGHLFSNCSHQMLEGAITENFFFFSKF